MRQGWWRRLMAILRNPIPHRRGSSIARWWEWGGRLYRISARDQETQ